MLYEIEQVADKRWFYKFEGRNRKGEQLIVEVTVNRDSDYKKSLPKVWYKNGYTKKILKEYISINTYIKDLNGNSWGKYNPQHKLSEDGKRQVLNFNWLLDNNKENLEKLLNETYRMFMY